MRPAAAAYRDFSLISECVWWSDQEDWKNVSFDYILFLEFLYLVLMICDGREESLFYLFQGFFLSSSSWVSFSYMILRSTCRMLFGPRLPDVGIPWTDRIVIIFFFFSFFFSIVALRCHFNSRTRNNKINNTTTTTASSSYYSTKERIFDSIFKFLSSEMAGVDILSFRFIAQQTSICSAWCVNACAIFFPIIRRGLLSIQ